MLTLLSVGLALRFLRFLQVPPLPGPPAPDVMAQLGQLIQAWEGKQWVLLGALVIGLVVSASKTGWLGNWVATKLPPAMRPVLAVVVGVLSVTSTEVVAGIDWKLAVLHAVYAAATAVLGHQVFVEGLRKGKEFVPIAKWSMRPPPPPGAPPAAGGSQKLAPPPKVPTDTGPTIKFSEMMPVTRRNVVVRTGALAFLAFVVQGCAAVTSWWQQFLANPAATVSALVQYVQGFITTAQTFWNMFIAPSLGENSASATATFNNLIVTAGNALAALEDAVQAAVLAQQPNPNFAQLIAAVQDAVAQIFATIQKWQPASQTAERAASFAAANDSLTHQAKQIAAWGHK
jgi:hypothetical protein